MDFNDYQVKAEQVTNRTEENTDFLRFLNFGLGLAGESGEVCEILKKAAFHGHELDREVLKLELGDVMWYITVLASTVGISLEEIAVANIDKLAHRYPNGFITEDGIKRQNVFHQE